MKVLLLGASGMLGHVLARELTRRGFEIYGTTRTHIAIPGVAAERIIHSIDATDYKIVAAILEKINPTTTINAVGLIRQRPEGQTPLPAIEINAKLPHVIAKLCAERGIRFIHYSTDCVFDGHKGAPYTEEDPPTAKDVYGLTKYLGEVGSPALTLRTSIIGPELRGRLGLLEWFLAQSGTVCGYTKAIYTGLPTLEQARILAEYVLPKPELSGLYQISSSPISKFDLLQLFARAYGKDIVIEPDDKVNEDKRLSGEAFYKATGYRAPEWPDLVDAMAKAT